MADVISRIVLQASGGDQVAREVGKVKKAYEEAGESAKGMSASGAAGGGQSAFERATSPPSSVTQADESRAQASARLREEAERRRQTHESLPGHSLNRGMAFNARGATGMVNNAAAVAAGNPVGGAAGGLSSMAALGPAGIAAAVGGAILMGGNKLAEKAGERQRQLFYGLGQGLGQDEYDPFRDSVRQIQEQGYEPNLMTYLQSLKASGGTFDTSTAMNALSLNFRTGADVSQLARFQGVMERTGFANLGAMAMDTDTSLGGWTARKAEDTFGRGRMGEFYGAVSTAVEGAITRGFERGSSVFANVYGNYVEDISDLANFGNVGPEAAVGIFNKVQGGLARSESGISTPQDAAAFMAMRQPGESYVDTILRMSSPEAEDERYMRLRSRAGDDRGALVQMVAQEFGLTIREADRYVDAKEGRIRQDELNAQTGTSGSGTPTVSGDTGVLADQAASSVRGNTGQNITEGALDVFTQTTQGIQALGRGIFGRKGTPEEQARAATIEAALNERSGSFYDEAVGQFGAYQQFRAGNTDRMSAEQIQYYTENQSEFEAALNMMNQLQSMIDSGDLSEDEVNRNIRRSNNWDDFDLNKDIVSILDILGGLLITAEAYADKDVTTDAGATE